MFIRLLFILTFIPFVEIYFLIQMSDSIGFGNTVLVVLATGVLGAWLLRKQGHSILTEMQQQGAQGQLPSDAIAKGFFTFVGGLLLLTPGILTDFIGLSLIFPLTQHAWKRFFMGQWESGVRGGNIRVFTQKDFRPPGAGDPFKSRDSFSGTQQSHRVDSSVIDIQASSSETKEKEEQE